MRVQVRKVGYITVKPEVHKRIAKCESQNLCYACLQRIKADESVVRHNHERCYRALLRAIERGATTDDICVEKGLMASQASAGRKPNHPALKDL